MNQLQKWYMVCAVIGAIVLVIRLLIARRERPYLLTGFLVVLCVLCWIWFLLFRTPGYAGTVGPLMFAIQVTCGTVGGLLAEGILFVRSRVKARKQG